ncbi:hypothetical protein vBVpaPMGD2_45 [Vibrio phage vB_VpaP_MGD2]|uniref:DUF3102 domain-containing protein n=1 Tax=Vibrio phage vB_VpaP_MGD2 TaxID=2565877 RepID=A0A6B7HXE0_9CAUD|nr:hypothetical protein vBVpaPMGD2_45 [Vibrio phage vB_VpaP_MGD2]
MSEVITRMQEITLEVCSKLDTIQQESLAVGKLLREALEIMKDEGKKQAEFVEYCKLNFSIGKSQAYKLMKVSEFFEGDKRFNGVAMRVLYVLATEANEEQLEKAAELAANDSLNTGTLNAILYPEAPEKQEPEAPKETTEQAEEKKEEAEESLNSLPNADDVPFDMEGTGDSVQAQMQQNDTLQEANETVNKAELDAKDKLIEELRTTIAELNKTLSEVKSKSERKPVAPMLPQFKNACPYAVLGLGQVESKKVTHVKKAFRELIKCGYGDGHEAFELLVKAKDQLLADIEEAKTK